MKKSLETFPMPTILGGFTLEKGLKRSKELANVSQDTFSVGRIAETDPSISQLDSTYRYRANYAIRGNSRPLFLLLIVKFQPEQQPQFFDCQ